jgi:hypothetical protein
VVDINYLNLFKIYQCKGLHSLISIWFSSFGSEKTQNLIPLLAETTFFLTMLVNEEKTQKLRCTQIKMSLFY